MNRLIRLELVSTPVREKGTVPTMGRAAARPTVPCSATILRMVPVAKSGQSPTVLKPVLVVTLTILACAAQVAWAGRTDKRLDIYWIDVEGGAATLIVTPHGRVGA